MGENVGVIGALVEETMGLLEGVGASVGINEGWKVGATVGSLVPSPILYATVPLQRESP